MLDWMLNAVLLLVCFVVAFFFLKRRDEAAAKKEREKALAAAAKDKEEGSDENKPILLAVNYKVFDVTKGKEFYGRGDKLYLTSLNIKISMIILRSGKCLT